MAGRLVNAGVARADGFVLNMTGYRTTRRSLDHGTRLSKCLYLKITMGTSACTAARLAAVRDDTAALPHFLVDTARNGTGEWTPPPGRFRVPDEWCNPPGRGAGARPTTATGRPVADALLWLNGPGYSNGQCTRGGGGPADPVYGFVTPPSGQWWPELALDRARNASPPLAGS
jgi:glycosyl hydrolase family 6